MRKSIVGLSIICLLALALVAGCGKKEAPTTTNMPPGPSAMAPATTPAPPAPAAKSSPADLAALKIKNALATNKEKLGVQNLQVDASGNVVTIRGNVKDEHLKALADKVAASVAGGVTVKNELQVVAK